MDNLTPYPYVAAFRQLFAVLVGILRAVPKESREAWIRELNAKMASKVLLRSEEFLAVNVITGPGMVSVKDTAAAGPGALREIISRAAHGLCAVPPEIRQTWCDELEGRSKAGEVLPDEESNICLILMGLPITEAIAASYRQQEQATDG